MLLIGDHDQSRWPQHCIGEHLTGGALSTVVQWPRDWELLLPIWSASSLQCIVHPVIIIIITRPWLAFGRQGLVGSSGGYTYHGYTSHASPRACGARLGRKVSRNGRNVISPIYRQFWKVSSGIVGRVHLSQVHFLTPCLAPAALGSAEKCLEMGET